MKKKVKLPTKCPICPAKVPRTPWLKNHTQSLRLHIIGHARSEALQKYLGLRKDAPHAAYLKKNVVYKRTVRIELR